MALLFTDSFDAGDISTKWVAPSAATSSSTRWGTGLAGTLSGSNDIKRSITASSQVTVGAAFLLNPGKAGFEFFGDTGTTVHIAVARTSNGLIEVRRGSMLSGTIIATGTTFIPSNVWFYLEVQVTVADSGGTVKVRLNGASTNEIDFTGDTKNSGTATTIDQVELDCSGSASVVRFDDLYILNSTGSSNTTFLGDVHIHSLSPSGNGTYSQLTGSDGNQTDNYLLVDEKPFSTADYVGSATVGQRDTYAMADLPTVTQIFGLQNNFIGAKSDASAASAKSALLISSTLYYGATRALSTSYIPYYDLYDTNPNTTVAWTSSDVNNLEAGIEVA